MRLLSIILFTFINFSVQALIKVDLKLIPATPQEGENTFEMILSEDGKPLKNAKVSAVITMPPMGTMPKMTAKARFSEKGEGKYQGDYELSMGGSWDVEIKIESLKETKKLYYTVTTGVLGFTDKNPPDPENKKKTK